MENNGKLIHLADREMLCYLEPAGMYIEEFGKEGVGS